MRGWPQFPAMQWSMQDLFFRLPSNPIIRQAAKARSMFPRAAHCRRCMRTRSTASRRGRTAKAEKGTVAANQTPGLANGPVNQSMNAEARHGRSGGMAPNHASDEPDPERQLDRASWQPDQTKRVRLRRRSPGDECHDARGARARIPIRLRSAGVDEALIQRILALPPQQRVLRLQQMQPEDFESFIKSLRPVQRQALVAGMSPDLKESVGALENPEQTTAQELFAERLTRDIYANAQLQEVMTDFWLNHFNVYLRKNEQMPYYLVSYERDVIRPRALGKFEDLLEAVAHSPAMMLYLDNAESMGPDSPAARAREDGGSAATRCEEEGRTQGLNENYARELMELHTLGVNGGYTQADVTQVARVLTGWTVDRPQYGGDFIYAPKRHEPGTKNVLGTKIKENGEMEGQELLHMLAMRPATAQFISRKLAIRFVSDDPPQALVDRMAKAYLASGGDIPTVLKTLFHSPEFWAASDYRAKVKTPLEFVVSAVRASNANVENFQPLVNAAAPDGHAAVWLHAADGIQVGRS